MFDRSKQVNVLWYNSKHRKLLQHMNDSPKINIINYFNSYMVFDMFLLRDFLPQSSTPVSLVKKGNHWAKFTSQQKVSYSVLLFPGLFVSPKKTLGVVIWYFSQRLKYNGSISDVSIWREKYFAVGIYYLFSNCTLEAAKHPTISKIPINNNKKIQDISHIKICFLISAFFLMFKSNFLLVLSCFYTYCNGGIDSLF